MSITILFAILFLAFVCEYMDASLGMGYGTTLTPVLLLMGYGPMEVVPAVLCSELLTGLLAAAVHHRQGNANFKPKTLKVSHLRENLSALGYVESFKRGIPVHLQIALLLAVCSGVGTVAAVVIAVNVPKYYLTLYIGSLVLAMGIVILACHKRSFVFSWKKITSLGLIASFNKGLSGGGYGPLVTGGQILSGVQGANAVAITSLAEGLTCLVGVVMYLVMGKNPFTGTLVPWLCVGAAMSVPFSAMTVKKIRPNTLKLLIAMTTISLGVLTLYKTIR